MKGYVKNVVAIVIGCLFALILLFVFVILFAKSGIILKGSQITSITSLKEDPLVGYTYNPNIDLILQMGDKGEHTVHINNIGFRGHDYNFEEDIKSRRNRIMVLGDSFTFGSGVWTTFSDHMGDMLNNRDNSAIVYNFGLPGYSSHNQLGVLRKYGESVKPKIVVIAFYLGNDFRENLVPISDTKIVNGYLVNNTVCWADKKTTLSGEELKKYSDIAVRYRLSAHSMMQIIKVDKFGSDMTFIERTVRQLAINFPQIKFYTDFVKQKLSVRTMEGLHITTSAYYNVSDEEMEITKKYLYEIKSECQEIKANLIVAIIPEHLGNYDNQLKRETITGILKQLNIQHYIDLFPLLKKDMDRYYLKSDDHLSQSGHAVVAECIVAYIQKHNLLEKILPKID